MRRWSRWTDDRGSAALEFVTTGVLLLVPLVYLVLTMASLQAGAFAAEGAARQAARVFVQADSLDEAEAAAERAVAFALADFGLPANAASVEVSCHPEPGDCLSRRSFVTVSVRVSVALPLTPPALTVDAPLSVALDRSATQQVSRFWGTG